MSETPTGADGQEHGLFNRLSAPFTRIGDEKVREVARKSGKFAFQAAKGLVVASAMNGPGGIWAAYGANQAIKTLEKVGQDIKNDA